MPSLSFLNPHSYFWPHLPAFQAPVLLALCPPPKLGLGLSGLGIFLGPWWGWGWEFPIQPIPNLCPPFRTSGHPGAPSLGTLDFLSAHSLSHYLCTYCVLPSRLTRSAAVETTRACAHPCTCQGVCARQLGCVSLSSAASTALLLRVLFIQEDRVFTEPSHGSSQITPLFRTRVGVRWALGGWRQREICIPCLGSGSRGSCLAALGQRSHRLSVSQWPLYSGPWAQLGPGLCKPRPVS